MRAVAGTLLPGDGTSPPATTVPDIDELLQRAAAAIGQEILALKRAIAMLPAKCDWAALSEFAEVEPTDFDLIWHVAAGAYFMSPTVLASIGYPTGTRIAPPFDEAAGEIASGILEPVIARGPRVRPLSP